MPNQTAIQILSNQTKSFNDAVGPVIKAMAIEANAEHFPEREVKSGRRYPLTQAHLKDFNDRMKAAYAATKRDRAADLGRWMEEPEAYDTILPRYSQGADRQDYNKFWAERTRAQLDMGLDDFIKDVGKTKIGGELGLDIKDPSTAADRRALAAMLYNHRVGVSRAVNPKMLAQAMQYVTPEQVSDPKFVSSGKADEVFRERTTTPAAREALLPLMFAHRYGTEPSPDLLAGLRYDEHQLAQRGGVRLTPGPDVPFGSYHVAPSLARLELGMKPDQRLLPSEIATALANPSDPNEVKDVTLRRILALQQLHEEQRQHDQEDVIPTELAEKSHWERFSPLVYQGRRVAEPSELTLEGERLMREIGEKAPATANEKAYIMRGLARDVAGIPGQQKNPVPNPMDVFGDYIAEIRKGHKRYEDQPEVKEFLAQKNAPNFADNPWYARHMEAARGHFATIEHEAHERFKNELLPQLRGRFHQAGAYQSTARIRAEEELVRKFQDDQLRRAQTHMHDAHKYASDMVAQQNRERYVQAHGAQQVYQHGRDEERLHHQMAQTSMEQQRQLMAGRADLEKAAVAEREKGQLLRQQYMSSLGQVHDTRKQNEHNTAAARFNEERDAPGRQAAAAAAIHDQLQQPAAVGQVYPIPVPMAPNTPSAQLGSGLGAAETLHKMLVPGQNPHTHARGGLVSSSPLKAYRDVLANTQLMTPQQGGYPTGQPGSQPMMSPSMGMDERAYRNQLSNYRREADAYKQREVYGNPAWRGVGDIGAALMKAGSGKHSPLEMLAEAHPKAMDRFDTHAEKLMTKAKENVSLEDYLTDKHKELFKAFEEVQHNKRTHDETRRHHMAEEAHHKATLGETASYHNKHLDYLTGKGQGGNGAGVKKPYTAAQLNVIQKARKKIGDAIEGMAEATRLEAMSEHMPLPNSLLKKLTWSGSQRHEAYEQFDALTASALTKTVQSQSNPTVAAQALQEKGKPSSLKPQKANEVSSRVLFDTNLTSLNTGVATMRDAGIYEDDIQGMVQEDKERAEGGINYGNDIFAQSQGLSEQQLRKMNEKSYRTWGGGFKEEKKAVHREQVRTQKQPSHESVSTYEAQNEAQAPDEPYEGAPIPSYADDVVSLQDRLQQPLGGQFKKGGSVRLEDYLYEKKKSPQPEKVFIRISPQEERVESVKKTPAGYIHEVEDESPLGHSLKSVHEERRAEKEEEKPARWKDYAMKAAEWGSMVIPIGGAGAGLVKLASKVATPGRIAKAAKYVGENLLGGNAFKQAFKKGAHNTEGLKTLVKSSAAGAVGSNAVQDLTDMPEWASDLVGGTAGGLTYGLGRKAYDATRGGVGQALRSAKEGIVRPHQKRFETNLYDYLGGKVDEPLEALRGHKEPFRGYEATTAEAVAPSEASAAIPMMARLRGASPHVVDTQARQYNKVLEELGHVAPEGSNAEDVYSALRRGHERDLGHVAEEVERLHPQTHHQPHEVGERVATGLENKLGEHARVRRAATEPLYEQAFSEGAPEVMPTQFGEKVSKHLDEVNTNDIERFVHKFAKRGGVHPEATALPDELQSLWHNLSPEQQASTIKQLGLGTQAMTSKEADVLRREIDQVFNDANRYQQKDLRRVMRSLSSGITEDLTNNNPLAAKAKAMYAKMSVPVNAIEEDRVFSRLLDETLHGEPKMARGAIPLQFLKGAGAHEASRKLVKTLGKESSEVASLREYALQDLFDKALTKDGTLDLKKMVAYRNQNPGLMGLDPSLVKDLARLAKAQEKLMQPFGRKDMGATDVLTHNRQKGHLTGTLLKNPHAVPEVLKRLPALETEARRGLAQDAVDHMLGTLQTRQGAPITSHAFETYMQQNGDTLKQLLSKPSLKVLEGVERAYKGLGAAARRGSESQSITQPRLEFEKKFFDESMSDKLRSKVFRATLRGTPVVKHFASEIEQGFGGKTGRAAQEGLVDQFLTDKGMAKKTLQRLQDKKDYLDYVNSKEHRTRQEATKQLDLGKVLTQNVLNSYFSP